MAQTKCNYPYLRPMSQLPSPARTLLFVVNCGQYAWRQNYGADNCCCLAGIPATIRGWHGSLFTFNTSFVNGRVRRVVDDGHVRPVRNRHSYVPRIPSLRPLSLLCGSNAFHLAVSLNGPIPSVQRVADIRCVGWSYRCHATTDGHAPLRANRGVALDAQGCYTAMLGARMLAG